MQDPHHPIVERPWEYEIVGLSYKRSLQSVHDSHLDLILQKGNVVRRLRFLSPQGLEIEDGFPHHIGGLYIADVSGSQLDGLSVRVDDFEQSRGAIRFWARKAIELGDDAEEM